MNVLGIIVFCVSVGVVVSYLGAVAKPIADFFVALDVVITTIVGVVCFCILGVQTAILFKFQIMWFAPFGILSLIAGESQIS